MATVRSFEVKELERSGRHSDVRATITTIDDGGEKFIQIDTYGSADRAMPDKVSQSLRLSAAAFEQLMQIGSRYF